MTTVQAPAVSLDVILRDGSTMRLRPPTRDDASALADFYSGLSERSLYQRFHGFPTIGPHIVEPLLDPDWTNTGAFVGSVDGRIVAVANYGRLRDPASAEVAVPEVAVSAEVCPGRDLNPHAREGRGF